MSLEDFVKQWLLWDRDPQTRGVIQKLHEEGNEKQLKHLLENRMVFGTAGLRAKLGPGNSQMNSLTVIQTAQGLSAHLKSVFSGDELSSRGVVIGFDARHGSERFARLSANVFLNAGIRTRLFSKVVPTPFVAFSVRHFSCVAGVMVTASHNPKEDNGYKIYWSNGSQIVSPQDEQIAKAILNNLVPLSSSWEWTAGASDPFDEVWTHYFASLKEEYRPLAAGHPLPLVYTALHGVGCPFVLGALETVGFPRHSVKLVNAQVEPDPEFPTVKFPNPEEGIKVFALAIQAATAADSDYILANDPDADRLAVAERQENGNWRVFTGNELGALLGWWFVFRARHFGESLEKCYFLYSIVSSKILRSIAIKEGINYLETLTGFKWMGSLAESLQRTSAGRVIFAYEESIGYMCGTRVFDKDGVTAAAIVADMIAFLRKENGGKRLSEQLIEIFSRYGYHFSCNSYVIAPDPTRIRDMFKAMVTMHDGSYPVEVAGARVVRVRDLVAGLDTKMPDKRARFTTSASSPILTFDFDNGVTMTFRASGTEAKLKWYAELITSDSTQENELPAFVEQVVEELVRPSYYNFQRRSQL